jgi:hypothetical protein
MKSFNPCALTETGNCISATDTLKYLKYILQLSNIYTADQQTKYLDCLKQSGNG